MTEHLKEYQFKKGNPGGPGRPPEPEGSLTSILKARLDKRETADKIIELMRTGNMKAIEVILDRLDGKVTQNINQNVNVSEVKETRQKLDELIENKKNIKV